MLLPKPVYIIAEAGVNHNGSLSMAKELIDVAAESGVDAVKFQTFNADKLVSKDAPKAIYQKKLTNEKESQYDMLKKLEFNSEGWIELKKYCTYRNIQFLSTPFDCDSLHFLIDKFDLPYIKIPSGEITNAPFLLEISRTGKPIILSTGMSTIGEIEQALMVLAFGYINSDDIPNLKSFSQAYISRKGQEYLKEKVVLLHCTTEYPAPVNEVNLKAMDTLRTAFKLKVGFSDHTEGIIIPIAAVARGASVIEKHFTLNKQLHGPDHKASLEPNELKNLVRAIREIELSIGDGIKRPSECELSNIAIARKSLIAAKDIYAGQVLSEHNLAVKRPGDGISPMFYYEWLGKKALRNYHKDEKV